MECGCGVVMEAGCKCDWGEGLPRTWPGTPANTLPEETPMRTSNLRSSLALQSLKACMATCDWEGGGCGHAGKGASAE